MSGEAFRREPRRGESAWAMPGRFYTCTLCRRPVDEGTTLNGDLICWSCDSEGRGKQAPS